MIQCMASKHNTRKNPIGPNQPPTREVKNSATTSTKYFKVPYDFITSQFTKRYKLDIPTQPTLDSSYTSLPNTSSPH